MTYIFAGEDMAIVRRKAFDFAKGLNCSSGSKSDDSPCGICLSCRTFDSGSHPDTFFVTGTKQSGIGVDDVREQIIGPIVLKPFRYDYKIFIVEKAETLTPAAQNALLKTIEEPAPYGVFLFLAPHIHHFLPTVLSRCVLQKVQNGSHGGLDGIKGQTRNGEINKDLLALAEKTAAKVGRMDTWEAFALYRDNIAGIEKKDLNEFLDLLYTCVGKEVSESANKKVKAPDTWINAAEAIVRTKRILAQNGNTQLAIELMFQKIGSK